MRFSFALTILAAILFLPSMAAHADPITNFTFIGTWEWEPGISPQYGASGTITVDTATGTVQAIDLTLEGLAGDAVVADTASGPAGTPPDFTEISEVWLGPPGINYYEAIDLLLPTPSLVGYAGGNICSVANPCIGAVSTTTTGIVDNDFIDGALTPAPEPSGWTLLGIGILAMIGTLRGRLLRASRDYTAPAPSA